MTFLNQQKGENDHRNISWSNLHKRCCRGQPNNLLITSRMCIQLSHQGRRHFCGEIRKISVITKTHLYNTDPLKPHFYIVKLGFTGVYIIFLISAQNIDCGYSLELPPQGGSNEYPQSMFWAEIWKISEFFIWKFSFFLVIKVSVYLNRHVFVMTFWLRKYQIIWSYVLYLIIRPPCL